MLYPMRCLSPVKAYIDPLSPFRSNGKVRLTFRADKGIYYCDLPCGKCALCRDNRRREWIKRLQAETFDNVASFLTLTIRDSELDKVSPRKSTLQRFFKRFRVYCERHKIDLSRFKYFAVNEFGKKSCRLHFHAILFGVNLFSSEFEPYLATTKFQNGRYYPIYASAVIEKLWTHGYNSVDKCTDASIRYVAKYVAKSAFDESLNAKIVDAPLAGVETAEHDKLWYIYSQRIGTSLFLLPDRSLSPFGRSTFSSGRLLLSRDSFPSRAPRFLDRYASISDASLFDAVKSSRRAFAARCKTDFAQLKGQLRKLQHDMAEYESKEVL